MKGSKVAFGMEMRLTCVAIKVLALADDVQKAGRSCGRCRVGCNRPLARS